MENNDLDKGHVHGEDCDHDDQPIVTLTLEDDSEMECAILGTFDVEDQEYIALVPLDSDEALIYRFAQNGDDDIQLSSIDDDEEFQKVSDAFYEFFSEEYEEDEEEEEE